MNFPTKNIVVSLLVAAALIFIIGAVLPALISAPSTVAVFGGALSLLGLAIGGVLVIRNVLGMKPEPAREDDDSLDFFE